MNQAVMGKTFCIYHDPALPKKQQESTLPSDAFDIVPIDQVPTTARFSQPAADLVKAARALEGKALRVKVKVFSKTILNTALRYSLDGGPRIGVRIVDDVAYVWKLRPEELKKMQDKSERMKQARAGRGKRKVSVAA